jgi:hypothetical protein
MYSYDGGPGVVRKLVYIQAPHSTLILHTVAAGASLEDAPPRATGATSKPMK